MKPTFMVIGAAKCATTTLCARLGQHPDVFVTDPKEPDFFSWDYHYNRGLEWYERLYASAGEKRARGEGSASYTSGTKFPHTAERIAAYAPGIRLIYIVRHPLEKLQSQWVQCRSQNSSSLVKKRRAGLMPGRDFEQASRSFADLLDTPNPVDAANYWKQINYYRPHFSDNQILVVFLEDLKTDDRATLARCFEFLGVDPEIGLPSQGPLNRSADKTHPRPIFSRLRNLPGIRRAYPYVIDVVPESLRRTVGERLLRVPAKKPSWDPEIRRSVVESLRDDTKTFLEFYGKPPDFWQLDVTD